MTLGAGVIATGIRGALGTSAAAAKDANASAPLGVLIFVVVVDVGRVVVLAVNGGGVFVEGLMACPVLVRVVVEVLNVLFIAGGV